MGSLGEIAIVSFQETRIITTCGEGGTILTKRKDLTELCYQLRNQCNTTSPRLVGGNFRMTAMEAAMDIAQMKRIDTILNELESHGKYVLDQLPYCLSSRCRVPYSQRIYYKLALYHEKVGEMTPNMFAEVFNARRNAILTSSNSDIPAANNSPGGGLPIHWVSKTRV